MKYNDWVQGWPCEKQNIADLSKLCSLVDSPPEKKYIFLERLLKLALFTAKNDLTNDQIL